jgi:hypothetical protein
VPFRAPGVAACILKQCPFKCSTAMKKATHAYHVQIDALLKTLSAFAQSGCLCSRPTRRVEACQQRPRPSGRPPPGTLERHCISAVMSSLQGAGGARRRSARRVGATPVTARRWFTDANARRSKAWRGASLETRTLAFPRPRDKFGGARHLAARRFFFWRRLRRPGFSSAPVFLVRQASRGDGFAGGIDEDELRNFFAGQLEIGNQILRRLPIRNNASAARLGDSFCSRLRKISEGHDERAQASGVSNPKLPPSQFSTP